MSYGEHHYSTSSKMKFVASLVLGCLFFGFLKVATSDLLHTREHDILATENVTESDKENDRTGALAIATATANYRPSVTSKPSPMQLVECYACTGCQTTPSNTTSKLCPFTLDSSKQGRCVSYSEQYRHMKNPWHIRGCASERGSCADIRKAHSAHSDIVRLLHCSECVGDRCNSASHSIADFTMAFFVMIITPMIAKYTLS